MLTVISTYEILLKSPAMTFEQTLILHIPVVLLGIIIVISAIAISMAILVVVWRYVPHEILITHHRLASPIFPAIAAAYSVLLAFVVVVSWQNFDKAKVHTVIEANCLVDLYRNSAAFSEPFGKELRNAIQEYTESVINEEWPLLARSEESIHSRMLLRKIWDLYTNHTPENAKETVFLAESVHKLDDLRETRRLRIMDSTASVHHILWFILIFGGIITVNYTTFFGFENFKTHAVMTAIFASIISLILLTVLCFDFPFTGSVRIEPTLFKEIINY
jgi:hypothetical protein